MRRFFLVAAFFVACSANQVHAAPIFTYETTVSVSSFTSGAATINLSGIPYGSGFDATTNINMVQYSSTFAGALGDPKVVFSSPLSFNITLTIKAPDGSTGVFTFSEDITGAQIGFNSASGTIQPPKLTSSPTIAIDGYFFTISNGFPALTPAPATSQIAASSVTVEAVALAVPEPASVFIFATAMVVSGGAWYGRRRSQAQRLV